ncbi:MAG: hypothetical protein R6V12_10860, partial [Candidatus Hydrogenedentota bacterium]
MLRESVVPPEGGDLRNQQAIKAAPKILDEMQQVVATELQAQMNNPAVPSGEVREAHRFFDLVLLPAHLHGQGLAERHRHVQR